MKNFLISSYTSRHCTWCGQIFEAHINNFSNKYSIFHLNGNRRVMKGIYQNLWRLSVVKTNKTETSPITEWSVVFTVRIPPTVLLAFKGDILYQWDIFVLVHMNNFEWKRLWMTEKHKRKMKLLGLKKCVKL